MNSSKQVRSKMTPKPAHMLSDTVNNGYGQNTLQNRGIRSTITLSNTSYEVAYNCLPQN